MEAVIGQLRSLVCKLPEVPTICEHIRLALDDWSLQNRRKPIMTTVEFQQLCHTVCKALMETPGVSQQHRTCLQYFMAHSNCWKVVASYLKDTGELIYFQDKDFIVVSPRWLGEGVLSHVIKEFGFGGQHIPRFDMDVRGFLTKATLERLLQKSLGQQEDLIRVESLIHLMLKMHLCYENRTPQNVVIGYFLPVLFHIHQGGQHSQGQTQLEWPSGSPDNDKHFFVGWRLQCGDPTCTFLTPGFFPRLQVMLYNHFLEFEQGWMQDSCANCKMDDNVFGIATHGLDILVEYSGSIEFYVDILARSIAPPIQSMKFLQEHVVKPIRSLCASDEGCTGVVLVEGIVRQDCVKLLTLCRYRKEQSIPVEEMLRRVAASQQGGGEYYYHQWLEVAHKEAGQPPVLRAWIEYATLLDGHIILGQEHEIEKAKVRVTQEETEDCYPDSNVKQGKKRGSAVLISMEKYQYGYRLGGEVDRGRLESLAESLHLKLYGNICLNLSADDLRETIIDTAQTGISSEDECFVCFVNAHGGTADDGAHYFEDTEGAKFFLLDDIVDPFRKCQNLFGKPKLFFVNSCRGPLELGSANGLGVEQRVPLQWSEGKEVRYAQQYSDCLIVFATSEHAVSIRDNEYGTNFVFALMQAFNNKRKIRDVLSMTTLLTHVVVDVEEEEEVSGHVKALSQCPVVVVTSLRKKLYWRSG